MLKKLSLTIALVAMTGLMVHAEPQRARVTTENKLPEVGQAETGLELRFVDEIFSNEELIDLDANLTVLSPYLRYGLKDNFVFELEVPFVYLDRDTGGNDAGLGDLKTGFELVAFEDVYDYLYFIPHVHAEFKTGDEDEGLGLGDNTMFIGVSIGNRFGDGTFSSHGDNITWILDGTYAVRSDSENQLIGGVTVIWDISEEFAVLSELQVSDTDLEDSGGQPVLLQGGMTFNWSEQLHFGLYGGGVSDSAVDATVITFKTSYTW